MDKAVFQASVVEIGQLADELLEEGMIIFFDKRVRETVPDLADYTVMLDIESRDGDIVPGQTIAIGEAAFPILAVGDVANVNLRNLGHCVLVFDGSEAAALPGNIHTAKEPVPPVGPGTLVKII